MRELTTQQEATLTSTGGYRTAARVKVLRGATWHDLSAWSSSPSVDFLEEVNWGESTEAACATANVRCLRESGGVSLAPLVETSAVNLEAGSYNPLIKVGRTFVIETSVYALGAAPSTWTESFRGRIDEVDAAGDVTFTGRSYLWGLLQDTQIEVEREYGSALGVDVQTVMQDILDDNGLSGVSLYTPASPSWALKKYVQKCESVADALLALARQLGWEVRERWLSSGPNTGAWRVWFYSPERSASVAAWTYTAAEYERLEELRTSLADIRNVVEVVYSDSADRDAAGVKKRKTVQVSDSASITANGRRFMRIAEDAASNVDTSSEATTLANTGLADLKDSPLGLGFQVLHHPGLQLGDMVAASGNTTAFTGTQTLAAVALAHSFNAGGGTTKLTLVGKPSLGRGVWLQMEQRPGIAPVSPFTGPDVVSNLAAVETLQGLRVSFQPPTLGPVALGYELHVSTSSGFTPSDSTRRVVGSLTEMVVNDLVPGTTYYAKVIPRDAKGNRGTASSQVSFTPRYVEPRRLQPYVSLSSIIPNDSFEATNASGEPPDTWSVTAGTWSTTMDLVSGALSGARAVRFLGGNSSALASSWVTARPSEVYSVEAWAKRTAVTGANLASLLLDFADETFSILSSVSVTVAPTVADGWKRYYAVRKAPAGTKYIRARLNQGNTTPDDLLWDSVRVREVRFLEEELIFPGTGGFNFANSWADVNSYGGAYTAVTLSKGADDDVRLEGRVTRAAGVPAGGTNILTGLPTGYRPVSEYTLIVPTSTGPGTVTVTAGGDVVFYAGGAGWLSLDGIRFRGSPS